VVPLLAVCLLFMTAFYGVYAYLGDHARRLLGLSAAQAGLIVLAYGAGFGLASLGDRAVDRIGAGRLFPAALAAVAAVYAALVPALGTFPTLLALAAAWGFSNHFGLNILVLRLTEACPDARGAVLALNSAVTYAGAFLGAGLFGVLYDGVGFPALAGTASACAGLAAAIAAVALRPAAPGGLPAQASTVR
jgi:predicted MFS family arabinose efflux permease